MYAYYYLFSLNSMIFLHKSYWIVCYIFVFVTFPPKCKKMRAIIYCFTQCCFPQYWNTLMNELIIWWTNVTLSTKQMIIWEMQIIIIHSTRRANSDVSILDIIIDSLRQDLWGWNEITEIFSIKVLQVIELKKKS